MSTTSYKERLLAAGFDEATGEIYMSVSDAESPREVRFDEKPQTKRVPLEHPWCNVQFTEDYGGYDGPSAVAYDKDYIYITGTYDGSSWIEKFPRDPSKCLELDQYDLGPVGGG